MSEPELDTFNQLSNQKKSLVKNLVSILEISNKLKSNDQIENLEFLEKLSQLIKDNLNEELKKIISTENLSKMEQETILNQIRMIDEAKVKKNQDSYVLHLDSKLKVVQPQLDEIKLVGELEGLVKNILDDIKKTHSLIESKKATDIRQINSSIEKLKITYEKIITINQQIITSISKIKDASEIYTNYLKMKPSQLDFKIDMFKPLDATDENVISLNKLEIPPLNQANYDKLDNLTFLEEDKDIIESINFEINDIVNPERKLTSAMEGAGVVADYINQYYDTERTRIQMNLIERQKILEKNQKLLLEREKQRLLLKEKQNQFDEIIKPLKKYPNIYQFIQKEIQNINDNDEKIKMVNNLKKKLLDDFSFQKSFFNNSISNYIKNKIVNLEELLKKREKEIEIQKVKLSKIDQKKFKRTYEKEKIKLMDLEKRISNIKRKLEQELENEKEKMKQKNINELLEILDDDKSRELKNFISLRGGSLNWDDYYKMIIEYYNVVTDIGKNIGMYKREIRKYNSIYLKFYYHQLYIINYINLVLFKENYQVQQYINIGLVNFYQRLIANILERIQNKLFNNTATTKEDKKKKIILTYFYKYHFIGLRQLEGFLKELFNFFSSDQISTSFRDLGENPKFKIHFRMFYQDDSSIPNTIRQGIFLFNIYKTLLDFYFREEAAPIGVFLRINDWGRVDNKFFIQNSNRDGLRKDAMETCSGTGEIVSLVENLRFKDVFNSEDFNQNDILANYMAIPSFLQSGNSIMMITYGYSGVGKTFTLFGSGENKGVLQNSIIGIQGTQSIYGRCFEIYGRAFPYKSYWNRDPSEYNHSIYAYPLLGDHTPKEYNGKDIRVFINHTQNDDIRTYTKLEQMDINNFSKVVEEIDKIRVNTGRIKKTVNNPVSSRSIMMYEFKLILNDNQVVRFVVMDLPGKEDINKTFVKTTTPGLCYELNGNYNTNEGIRKAMFLNPVMLAIYGDLYKEINLQLNDIDGTSFAIDSNFTLFPKKISELKIGSDEENTERIKAAERIGHLISTNNLERLTELYRKILLKPNQTFIDKKDNGSSGVFDNKKCNDYDMASGSFEGFYINENINGIVEVLGKKLYPNDPSKYKFKHMEDIYYNLLGTDKFRTPSTNKNLKVKLYINSREKSNEFLFYDPTSKSDPINLSVLNNFNYSKTSLSKEQVKENFNGFYKKYENRAQIYITREIIKQLKNGELTINEINNKYLDNYDFNSVYSSVPPIETFLEPYFNQINNFFLLFVVSNKNPGKCKDQIQLIANSKKFFDVLGQY